MPRSRLPTLSILTMILGCGLPPEPRPVEESPGTPPGGTPPGETPPGETPPDPQLGECAKQRAAVEGLLRARCATCHDNGNTQGGLGSITALDGLVSNGYVVRGDASASVLFTKVESQEMPLTGDPLSDAELTVLETWIGVCTLAEESAEDVSLTEPPACPDNVPRPNKEQLAAIRDDIVRLDNTAARTTRYLSLAHLQGAGYCESQVEGYRHALTKLLNHLSLSPLIRSPVAIDAARTIYRINLFDYGWSEATWQSITAADPYAVVFTSEDALDIRDSADVDLFTIKADWFIDAASQPPLYHTILELPETRAELEASLGLDVELNIANELLFNRDDVVRAGFQESNVSFSNRVIERHQLPLSPLRAYWLSYDFAVPPPGAPPPPFKNILENPLDFEEDGGEIIFNLANGLQGYMLVNGAGKRIDRGPINVVHDKEVPEEPEVINGLSCMSCHSQGMRLATDEVAVFVADNTLFDLEEQQDVARLYAPSDVFRRLQQQDVSTFVNAMNATGALRQVAGREPVMAAHLAFEEPLDLRRAAAEFGVPEAELLKNLLSLRALTTIDRATVTRDEFEENFAFNACVLKLGETVLCKDGVFPQ